MSLPLADIDDAPYVEVTFTKNAVVTNPTAVVATATKPDGTVVTLTTTNPSTGIYGANITVDQGGVWTWKFKATGAVVAVFSGAFVAREFGLALVPLEEFKAALGLYEEDVDRDGSIYLDLVRASAAVRDYTGRSFAVANATTTRTYKYPGNGWLEIDDVSTITLVTLDGVSLVESTDYVAGPDRGFRTFDATPVYEYLELFVYNSSPEMGFERNLDTLAIYGRRARYTNVAVTGTWGWPSVPSGVKEAVILTAASFMERKRPYTSTSIDSYSVQVGPSDARNAIPEPAKELLSPFRRFGMGA